LISEYISMGDWLHKGITNHIYKDNKINIFLVSLRTFFFHFLINVDLQSRKLEHKKKIMLH